MVKPGFRPTKWSRTNRSWVPKYYYANDIYFILLEITWFWGKLRFAYYKGGL